LCSNRVIQTFQVKCRREHKQLVVWHCSPVHANMLVNCRVHAWHKFSNLWTARLEHSKFFV
jgi:hypothetical protein